MRLLALILLLIATPTQADIFLLRHAEIVASDNPDPPLSTLGEQRAVALAKVLAAEKPAAVFTTPYARTQGTAAPIADAAGVTASTYDPGDVSGLIETLKSAKGHQVVVGHSNTVPALVYALGGDPGADIDHSEFDRVYRLQKTDAGVETRVFHSEPIHERVKPTAFRVDADRLSNETLVFEMSLNGKAAGTSSWRYHRSGDRIEMEEITQLGDYDTEATIRIKTDRKLASGEMSMQGKMFGGDTDIKASWDPQHLTGSSLIPRASYRPQGRISLDSDHPRGAIERSTALMLAHAVSPPNAQSAAFRWFSVYDGEYRDIQVDNHGNETITVPAGTFDIYKLRYQGGAPSQIFYVTREAPYRTVRIDIIAMPWRYELLRIE